jgi:hypothetical protein
MATIKTAVQTLVKEFSDDNLTSYQKENDYLNQNIKSDSLLCNVLLIKQSVEIP